MRRLAECEDRAIDFRATVIVGYGAARGAELVGIVAREIRADCLPARSFVEGAMHDIRADIQHVGVVARHFDRKGPLEAILELVRADATDVVVDHFRPDGYVARLSRLRIPGEEASVARSRADADGKYGVRRLAAHSDVAALAAARLRVVAPADRALRRAAR